MKYMKDVTSTTWNKLFEIPTKAKTEVGRINAIMEYTDCYTKEEVKELLSSEWVTICEDGIIIWMDGSLKK